MPPAVVEGGGASRKRSLNGCVSCKSSKLKCDERAPNCGRCTRLRLECQKPESRPSLQSRRRGKGPLKSRQCWKPEKILPTAQENPMIDSSTYNQRSTHDTLVDDIAAFSWVDLDSLFNPTDIFTDYGNGSSDMQVGQSSMNRQSKLVSRQGIEMNDVVAASFDPTDTALPPISLPSISTLTHDEQRGLFYFQTKYTLSRHTRPFQWSCHELFLLIAVQQPPVLHLILAVSLNQLATEDQNETQDASVLSQKHYHEGFDALKKRLEADTPQGHLHTMISAWLLHHAILDQVIQIRIHQRQALSAEIHSYISKHKLVQLCTESLSAEFQVEIPDNIQAKKELSLLAKVLIWLFYSDIRFCFVNTGGSIANELMSHEEQLNRLFDVSQLALEVNWGSDYPQIERLRSIECLGLDQFNFEIQKLHYRLNCIFWSDIGSLDSIKRFMNSLEARYSPIFQMAGEWIGSYTYMLKRADILTCEFYALKIYWFRCGCLDIQTVASYDILNIAKQFLKIAHRIWDLGCGPTYFDSQLFLVGTETQDPIHRDWIRNCLHEVPAKDALTMVWQEQDNRQTRLTAREVKQMLTRTYL